MDTQTPAPPLQSAVQAAPRRGLLRRGLARTLLGVIVVVIVLVLMLVAGLSLLKSSRAQPPTIDPYPNARIVNKHTDPSADRVIYSTMDKIDTVADFYVRRLGSSQESGCKHIYYDEKHSEEPGRSYYRCIVDTSLLEMQQSARVTITYKKETAETLIDISRNWGSGQ